MYGRPFLPDNFPISQDFPIVTDHIPNFFIRDLLQQHTYLCLLQPTDNPKPDSPVTPGDLIYLKTSKAKGLHLKWTEPCLVILTTATAVKVASFSSWFHITQAKHFPDAPNPKLLSSKWSSHLLPLTLLHLTCP